MPTDVELYARLRRNVGASEGLITDSMASATFAEALERYPTNSAKRAAYAEVLTIKGIRASSAMLGKYAQNQSQDDLTKVFDNLTVMLKDAEREVSLVTDVEEVAGGGFVFGAASGTRGR